MAVVAVARSANPRQRDRLWLIAVLTLPLILLALLAVAPFFGPVEVQLGNHLVRMIYYRLPEPGKSGMHLGRAEICTTKKPWHFTVKRALPGPGQHPGAGTATRQRRLLAGVVPRPASPVISPPARPGPHGRAHRRDNPFSNTKARKGRICETSLEETSRVRVHL